MPTTPNYGLRYPANTDSADIQGHIANLASDLDNQLLYFNSKQQGVFVIKEDFDQLTPLVTLSASSAEGNLISVPISGAQVGDSYRLTLFGQFLNNTGGNTTFNTRVKLGGSTYILGSTANISTNANYRPLTMTINVYVESLTVQHIFGQTFVGAAGATNWTTATYGIGGHGRQWSNQDLSTSKDLLVTQQHSSTSANQITEINGYVFERVW